MREHGSICGKEGCVVTEGVRRDEAIEGIPRPPEVRTAGGDAVEGTLGDAEVDTFPKVVHDVGSRHLDAADFVEKRQFSVYER